MKGKVVVITGATSGIGQVAAERLAGMGARIVLIARNEARAASTLARLRDKSPNNAHRAFYADLSSIEEVKRVAREIASSESRIDVLMNNAGAIFSRREVTVDGLERTFALNHVAYFVLTLGLEEQLRSGAAARIINTSSGAHRSASLDFEDLQSTRGYRAFPAYSRSKLCNILFTRELARRYQGTSVTANCLHPGFVATRFGNDAAWPLSLALRIGKMFAISPENGAETMVYLASSNDVAGISGRYFDQCKPVELKKEASDDAAAQRLWNETARLARI
jgi:NAD(P)-dependent dehydrogenase (short-subunit alcohol dehydrogenase family)